MSLYRSYLFDYTCDCEKKQIFLPTAKEADLQILLAFCIPHDTIGEQREIAAVVLR
jgi:hypothetical protein